MTMNRNHHGNINDSDDGHKLEDINYVMVDGNHEIAKGAMNTNESRIKSARNTSFIKGSFYSNADILGLPLPNQIKIN